MEQISAIVVLVVGVLQFILFFKIWGMTNDVNELKERFKANTLADDIRTAYLNGQKEIAQEILNRNYTEASETLAAISTMSEGYDVASNSNYIDIPTKVKCTNIISELEEVAERYNLSLPVLKREKE